MDESLAQDDGSVTRSGTCCDCLSLTQDVIPPERQHQVIIATWFGARIPPIALTEKFAWPLSSIAIFLKAFSL